MSSLNYKFVNLLGAPYRGGNLLLHGTELLSAVSNRVSEVRASVESLQLILRAAAACLLIHVYMFWQVPHSTCDSGCYLLHNCTCTCTRQVSVCHKCLWTQLPVSC